MPSKGVSHRKGKKKALRNKVRRERQQGDGSPSLREVFKAL